MAVRAHARARCACRASPPRRRAAMAGDVNIYFRESDLDEGEPPFSVGEIEVMVAEPASRRKGIATEALLLMMRYGTPHPGRSPCRKPTHARGLAPAWTTLRCSRFVAKILASNTASLALFARLGFRELRRVAAFDEVHMGFTMDGAGEARVLECDFELGRAE